MRLRFEPDDDAAMGEAVDLLTQTFEQDTGLEGWIPHQLLHYKGAQLDGRLDHWGRGDLVELLL
ncbi:MAG TPA: hypothetical protein VMM13_12095, partial [Euzebya sp.]|nr:hypothetical protein [Euzebya sp.]